MGWERLYGDFEKKKLRNGTLDCLGDEAKFPHVFSFFCLSFSFVSLSRACPRVTITIVPMLIDKII